MNINLNYGNLAQSYLFSTIAHKVAAFTQAHPDARILRLGIGDVTEPLCPAVVQAMQAAVQDMGRAETFHGYGPEQGYDFLRAAIRGYYAERGVTLEDTEIFVSDGAKSDLGNILDLFAPDNAVLIPDPVYPVYVDTNVMDGRTLRYLAATADNGFLPLPPEGQAADLIYLCSPNNPTGAAYSREQLAAWVDYARRQQAVLLFDAAYERFVQDAALPRSIFEIPGAETCAIEFCSLSKTAGFTGVRCGYTVVPHALTRQGMSLNAMWLRRQTTKFNGVSYIVQRGAAAVFTPEGRRQTDATLNIYRDNARVLSEALTQAGVAFTGGRNSPYLWMTCPGGQPSWDFFDDLLAQAAVVGTPGAGFGACGEGYFRLTAFGSPAHTQEAAERLLQFFQAR